MERCLKDEAADLQMKLGKKATFEDAVKKLTVLVSSKYQLADPEGREAVSASIYGREIILLKSNGSKAVDAIRLEAFAPSSAPFEAPRRILHAGSNFSIPPQRHIENAR